METRLQSHYESLSRVIRFTRMADTKAGAVLALQFVLLGALVAQSDPALFGKVRDVVRQFSGEFGDIVLIGVMALHFLATLVAVVTALGVYAPVTPKTGRSLIYFRDIAEMDCQQFLAAARGMDTAGIERQLLEQIYRVSGIARHKMQLLLYAFVASILSIITEIILLAWGRIPFLPG